MIYLVGGAPRAGKTLLGQRVAAKLKIGWMSTDILEYMLRVSQVAGQKTEWNADPEAISDGARWFYPYLDQFIFGIRSSAESYLIDGVDFLPEQVAKLSARYPIRAVFMGCSQMTLERLDRFPGRSKGYAGLPDDLRQRIAQDVPLWSEFIRQEAIHSGYPYVDTGGNFEASLAEAEALLINPLDFLSLPPTEERE